MKEEIWKDIPGYGGAYQISSLGRVKSLYSRWCKREMIMRPSINHGMYLSIVFGRLSNRMYVHRLVANAFIPNEHGKKEVNHIDGNPQNNCTSNLEWVTASENMKHSYRSLKRVPTITKECLLLSNKKCRKPIIQFDLLGNPIREWDSIASAQKYLNIDNISAACRLVHRTAGGFTWKFIGGK